MAYTIAEKILLAHSSKKRIKPGEFIEAKVDLCLGNDITAPLAIKEFEKAGFKKIFNRKKIALIPDHFIPAKDLKSANQAKILARFAQRYNIEKYFELGRMGIEHALLPEEGLVSCGDLVIGADSHTCTYGALGCFSTGVGSTDLARAFVDGKFWFKIPVSIKFIYKGKLRKWVCGKDLILFTIGKIGVEGASGRVMELSGPVIRTLPMEERFTMSNMAIEAGGVCGIIEPDKVTFDYIRRVRSLPGRQVVSRWELLRSLRSDKDAYYEKTYEWNVSDLEPLVALPHSPANVKPVKTLKNVRLDQVFIGSCTNGRLSDLTAAAEILKGKRVKQTLRLIVIPATQKIYSEAIKKGLMDIFVKAGAVVTTSTCGPCLGGHMGVLAAGERCLATTNRNFIGRMGHPESFVYLSSPAVAAASAITGRITHPEEVV
jgi:3-isopropylmalate/(R)-2-methylmalate dehydratase large subunit